uniref:RRM domain-containing protein n=1 Tax=Meloidogyne incognita TaxID=6306 RepID=A0A914MP56_MELIC
MPRPSSFLDPRRTIFIGELPRPTKASELVFVLESLYGLVCYAGIDVDPEMKYPKGAARVTFNTFKSYVAGMAGRFVNIPHSYFWFTFAFIFVINFFTFRSMLYCSETAKMGFPPF